MPYDQSKRLLKITTDLGPDLVLLTELDGVDELSRPFLFKLKLVSELPLSEMKTLLSSEVKLEFGPRGTEEARRPLRGHVRRLVRTALVNMQRNEWEWEAEVVPHFWLMSLRTNMRIFPQQTFSDIVKTLFGEYGMATPDIRANSSASSNKLDYCVQYRESDLDFLSRIMERYGWFYFHDHLKRKTQLIFGNANLHGLEEIELNLYELISMEEDFSVRSGRCVYLEYDPMIHDVAKEDRPAKVGGNALKPEHVRYDYAGAFIERSLAPGDMGLIHVGRELTEVAMEREEARHHLRRGASLVAHLDAGRRVKIGEQKALVTAVTHRARDYSHWTAADWGDQEQSAPFYENRFTCIPDKIPFRPEAITPRPVVDGPQTATVVTGGESPETCQHGRVKLRFHWARDGETSTWVRVSQGWASNRHGQQFMPRAGDEVIVEFLEGNPDRPIVTGQVYNGKNRPPFDLPDKHMQSGIKTSRDNQLRFDDTSGKEEVYVRAAKDLLTEVMDSETRKVGGGTGPGNRVTEIKNNDTLKIQQGNLSIRATAGNVEIEAGKQLVLKVGANKITISQDGVKVEGTMVDVKGQASANFEASGTTSVKGTMIMIG